MPTDAASASGTHSPADRRPQPPASDIAAHAAIRKDAFVAAFSGSASSPGPVRSQ